LCSIARPLELLHMNLFGPARTLSLGGKKYGLVIIDDYSIYIWVYFLAHKREYFCVFKILCKRVQSDQNSSSQVSKWPWNKVKKWKVSNIM